MDKIDNFIKYLEELAAIKEALELTDQLITTLASNLFLRRYKSGLDKFTDDNDKKMYILLTMTRDRTTCQALINTLIQCHQIHVAQMIAKYNKSPGPWKLTYEEKPVVSNCLSPKIFHSNCYQLSQPVRGRCLIVNTMEEPDVPYPDHIGLKRETIRFRHVFESLNFEVYERHSFNCQTLKAILEDFSQNEILKEDEAFVMIMISHGSNEQIYGADACNALKGRIPGAQGVHAYFSDVMDIKEFYGIFSEDKCPQLKSKPKLFFFICCRIEEPIPEEWKIQNNWGAGGDQVGRRQSNAQLTTDTFVSYSCAKGYKTFFNPTKGYTYFGLILTQTIAQYACEESLSQIMSRTNKRLYHLKEELFDDPNVRDKPLGAFAPEHIPFAMKHQVWFNPGYPWFEKHSGALSWGTKIIIKNIISDKI